MLWCPEKYQLFERFNLFFCGFIRPQHTSLFIYRNKWIPTSLWSIFRLKKTYAKAIKVFVFVLYFSMGFLLFSFFFLPLERNVFNKFEMIISCEKYNRYSQHWEENSIFQLPKNRKKKQTASIVCFSRVKMCDNYIWNKKKMAQWRLAFIFNDTKL